MLTKKQQQGDHTKLFKESDQHFNFIINNTVRQ